MEKLIYYMKNNSIKDESQENNLKEDSITNKHRYVYLVYYALVWAILLMVIARIKKKI